MEATLEIDRQKIMELLQEIPDPEIPALSVVDLGMIGAVKVEEEIVTIHLIPTFTACPAIKHIQNSIQHKLSEAGFEQVNVIIDHSVAWNSNRMNDEAKKKLKAFGLGTPQVHNGTFAMSEIEQCQCPHCGSSNTTMNSLFGSSLCRSMHYCFDCRQSFERFKPV